MPLDIAIWIYRDRYSKIRKIYNNIIYIKNLKYPRKEHVYFFGETRQLNEAIVISKPQSQFYGVYLFLMLKHTCI